MSYKNNLVILCILLLGAQSHGDMFMTVFGVDERTPINQMNPLTNKIGQLRTANGGTCTATLISEQHIITAAHCLYDFEAEHFHMNPELFIFYPGRKNEGEAPLGVFKGSALYYFNEFGEDQSHAYDVAVIKLDRKTNLGFIPLNVYQQNSQKFQIIGYPGDKKEGTLWQSRGQSVRGPGVNKIPNTIRHNADTFEGVSGAALLVNNAIVGIHVDGYEKQGFNLALVFNSKIMKILKFWLAQ